jgi:hypothetical protein
MFNVAPREHELENDEGRMSNDETMTKLRMSKNYSMNLFSFRISFVIQISSLCFQYFNERLLRNINFPDAFHPLFSFLLFLQQFPFTGNIAAVAFRCHVFP